MLPKYLDEQVARMHLKRINAQLTKMTAEQAAYLNLKVEGPYKCQVMMDCRICYLKSSYLSESILTLLKGKQQGLQGEK